MKNVHFIRLTQVFLLLCWFPIQAYSQAPKVDMPKSDRYYKKSAEWLQMMDDPSSNYFQTLRAFELYWEKNDKPLKRDAILSEEHVESRENKRFVKRLFRKEKQMDQSVVEGYKRFEFWKMEVEPYVQEDGRILTKDEQLEIWKQEKNRK